MRSMRLCAKIPKKNQVFKLTSENVFTQFLVMETVRQ